MKDETWILNRIHALRMSAREDMYTTKAELVFNGADMIDAKIRELEGILDTENKGHYYGLYGFGGRGGHFKNGSSKPRPVPNDGT